MQYRLTQIAFLLTATFCLTPRASPPFALALGGILAMLIENPFQKHAASLAKILLQISVVLLGFGMNLSAVLHAGASGFLLAAASIGTTLALGYWVGKMLGVANTTSALISAGTAICGGSAIAAVGSAIEAKEGDMTVAMGTVFLLNAVALYLFPILGHALGLNQHQFGTWAGIAIHDVSSVVGAASRYGLDALQIATAVKLSRSLWIVPVALGTMWAFRKEGAVAVTNSSFGFDVPAAPPNKKVHLPYFIGFFLLASLARSFIPAVATVGPTLSHAATVGLTLTLFLIGAGMNPKTLASVGWRALFQGAIIWIFISAASLAMILKMG